MSWHLWRHLWQVSHPPPNAGDTACLSEAAATLWGQCGWCHSGSRHHSSTSHVMNAAWGSPTAMSHCWPETKKNMGMKINWSICSWSIWGLLDLFSMREVKFITWWMTPKYNMLYQALCIISKPSVNSNWSYSPEMSNSGQNWWSCDLEIWWMTLKNNIIMAPHLWFQCGVKESGNAHIGAKFVLTFVTLSLILGAHYPWCKKNPSTYQAQHLASAGLLHFPGSQTQCLALPSGGTWAPGPGI